MTTVLISGAGIAGPTLAYWLARYGMSPIVVERFPAPRAGGQSVDVRGAGRTVAQRMGIEDAILAAGTGEVGLRFVDGRGRIAAEFGSGGGNFTSDLEILRGDLAAIVHESTRDDTVYVYGDSITAVDDDGRRVRVTLESGTEREVDLVVLADGLRSRTRGLVFGDEARVKDLGMYTSYFTVDRIDTDDRWARWYAAPGSRTLMIRPDNVGTTRVLMSFLSRPRGYETLSVAEQKSVLTSVFAGAGFQTERALAGLAVAPDFYFEYIGQVMMPRLSRGRVAVLGDAGYCPSPISGMGTSLALVGAYVLAGELARHSEHTTAFASYEKLMRPYITQAQQLPPGTPRLANPRTRLGVTAFNAIVGIGSSRPVAALAGRLFAPPADKIALPDYDAELRTS